MTELFERTIRVSTDPVVELFVAQTTDAQDATLVVIHGGPDWDHTYLVNPLVKLAPKRRVMFVDLRGCGRSTRGLADSEYVPAAAVSDLIALIRQCRIAPVDVLGFSFGGQLAQRLVAAAPELVRRTIIASSSVLPVRSEELAAWKERDRRIASQRPVDGYDDDAWDDQRTRLEAIATASTNIWKLELLPAYLQRLAGVHFSSDWSHAWPEHNMPQSRPDNVVETLSRLGKPLLLLHGEHDMTFPASLVGLTLSAIPNARGAVLSGAGHMAHIDQPEKWLAAVDDFLRPD